MVTPGTTSSQRVLRVRAKLRGITKRWTMVMSSCDDETGGGGAPASPDLEAPAMARSAQDAEAPVSTSNGSDSFTSTHGGKKTTISWGVAPAPAAPPDPVALPAPMGMAAITA